jgi:hypothetical protein
MISAEFTGTNPDRAQICAVNPTKGALVKKAAPEHLKNPPAGGFGMASGFECRGMAALIDTGASVSMVESYVPNRLKAVIYQLSQEQARLICTAEGEPMNLQGYIKACLIIGKGIYPHKFYVRGKHNAMSHHPKQFDMIIGVDLMDKIGSCTIDVNRKEIVFRDRDRKSSYCYKLDPKENRLIIRCHDGKTWTMGDTSNSSALPSIPKLSASKTPALRLQSISDPSTSKTPAPRQLGAPSKLSSKSPSTSVTGAVPSSLTRVAPRRAVGIRPRTPVTGQSKKTTDKNMTPIVMKEDEAEIIRKEEFIREISDARKANMARINALYGKDKDGKPILKQDQAQSVTALAAIEDLSIRQINEDPEIITAQEMFQDEMQFVNESLNEWTQEGHEWG